MQLLQVSLQSLNSTKALDITLSLDKFQKLECTNPEGDFYFFNS